MSATSPRENPSYTNVDGEFITPELDDMFPFLSQDKLEEIRKSSQDF